MKILVYLFGGLGVLLGALWLLQGLGLVHLQPILCVANCVPIQGPSITWTLAGALALLAGVMAIRFARTRRP